MRVATDIGGTFTDLVAFLDDGTIISQKTNTTAPNFEQGIINALDKAKIDIAKITFFVHGTTVIINALTEKKGCKVALITTEGFKDVLEIGRGNRPDYFNLKFQKDKPFVKRHLRLEVKGRVDYLGHEQEPLCLNNLEEIANYFKVEKVQAIAVCLINAYANNAHEIKLKIALKKLLNVPIIISSDLTRQWREYERSSTAVLCAYIYPIANNYLNKLSQILLEKNFTSTPYIMQSNGGSNTLLAAKQSPLSMIESGPSSGFLGALAIGKLIGEHNILALDIGGTTAKCSLIKDAKITIKTDYFIDKSSKKVGYPMIVPVVDLVEIGNGGGSIAFVNEFGKLCVGPKSAGSNPGPVAYDKGNQEPTTTDANIFLQRINSEYFCGGTMKAATTKVKKSLENLAQELNLETQELARGILKIANNNMVNALKLVSQNKGHDPRDFSLLCFGGGGALHACDMADALNMTKVIIPVNSGVFSAWGMLMSDLRRDYIQNKILELHNDNLTIIKQILQTMTIEAKEHYLQEGFQEDKLYYEYQLQLRYSGQEHAVNIAIDLHNLENVQSIINNFHKTHKQEYTYSLNTTVQMVGIHLTAFAQVKKYELKKLSNFNSDIETITKGFRKVDYLEDVILKTRIIDGQYLMPNCIIQGPAIIEQVDSTIVIKPQWQAKTDIYNNIIITKK